MTAPMASRCLLATVVVLAACTPHPNTPASPAGGGGIAIPVVGSAPETDVFTVGTGAVDSWSGWLPDGRTFSAFDTSPEPIARLNPWLLKAVQDATRAAAAQDVTIVITSGWRSRGFQQRLFADGIVQYGSPEKAGEFVASPDVSRHVLGEAVDIGGDGASEWMIRNGARFGLCQIYANENWHFELAVDDAGNCPPLRANAAG